MGQFGWETSQHNRRQLQLRQRLLREGRLDTIERKPSKDTAALDPKLEKQPDMGTMATMTQQTGALLRLF